MLNVRSEVKVRFPVIPVVAGLAMTCALAGCDPLVSGDDPISVNSNAGVFTITVCEQWTLTSVLVQTRPSAFGAKWEDVLIAEGRSVLEPGETLSASAPPVGMTDSVWLEPTLEPNDRLTITLGGENDDTLDAILTVPEGGLPSEQWLQADGRITAIPCEDSLLR